MKLLTVVGARPQFIKAAVVSRAIRATTSRIQECLVHTGQHFDPGMSAIFFDELAIPEPKYNLGIGGGKHGQNTGRMLERLEEVILDESPDWVLVYGDTDSTLAGALAAVKLHIPVAHVEAGLRSFNRRMPEEINRVLVDHVSSLLLTPSEAGFRNLEREGIDLESIDTIGDVMYDAALFYREKARRPSFVDRHDIEPGKFILCTIHRAENTDHPDRLAGILQGLSGAEMPVLLPLHPRTKGVLDRYGLNLPANVLVVEPVGYLEMVWLEANCAVVATDSGGVQKEAYFHRKGCVTLRDETEWVELVDGGYNTLVGTDPARIKEAIQTMKATIINHTHLYGEGSAGSKVVRSLLHRQGATS